MQLLSIHGQLRPACAFVRSHLPTEQATIAASTNVIQSTSILNDREQLSKCQKIEIHKEKYRSSIFNELDIFKQIRHRTFSHWPHRTSPSSEQMIEAGFFNCNVGDRVICLYCNIICQQWTPYTDDPCDVHKMLSPQCPYVVAKLACSQTSSIPIINENLPRDNSAISDNNTSIRCQQIVNVAVSNTFYREVPKRYESFKTWSNENSPSIDDLVKAGFFYTGTRTIVSCFYCNGSLQNWSANDNPIIEHARWFPHCAYIKQLCGDKLYRNIQESNRCQKERHERNVSSNKCETRVNSSFNGPLNIQNEGILPRLVAARLDLPITQRLLKENFKLSIIKRCWEDQLQIKEGFSHEQTAPEQILVNSSNNTDVEMSKSSESITSETAGESSLGSVNKKMNMEWKGADVCAQKGDNNSSPFNSCSLCLTEEKCLGCIPCGHVATCVPCGHSLRACPICRSEIKAFVRLYL
ncbi:unnamed protein product [Rotaria sp. Silwood2]|nr:unnamed protein product [Rotaria sp. Silwood2]